MTLTRTSSALGLPRVGAFLRREQFEDWSEIEAILASQHPLCDRARRADRNGGRGRYAMLVPLVALFCVAVLPLQEGGRDCGEGGCAANAAAEPVSLAPSVAPLPRGQVVQTDAVRDEAGLTEGRSSVADVKGVAEAHRVVPRKASFSTGYADTPHVVQGPRHRAHRHHAWVPSWVYRAWR